MVRPWAKLWIHGVPSGRRMILAHAAAVFDALDRIGQGRAFEAIRIGQDVGDGAAGELIVVERQHDVGQQDASHWRSMIRLAAGIGQPVRLMMRSAC